ncbi:MAG: ZIP family metal transporter, partial [Actinomycetota bacterium]
FCWPSPSACCLFLLIDTVAEGFELAAAAPAALDGLGIFFIGASGAALGLNLLEASLSRKRETEHGGSAMSGLALAYLIAAGIGLHNLGEGLAVVAALAAGEAALGTALVLGFALHNTTEGLAIVSPLGGRRARPSLWHFVAFGALAGAPAIIGAWIGGFAFSATWSARAFGLAAGAIAQVVWQIGKSFGGRTEMSSAPVAAGLLAGLAVMYLTGLIAA